jgi:hypothetical protein
MMVLLLIRVIWHKDVPFWHRLEGLKYMIYKVMTLNDEIHPNPHSFI